MTAVNFIERMQTGLWRENPGLVQLLGLCPLLAVTSTFVNGLGLGIATLLVLTCSNVLVSATRRWILAEIRVPIYVLIIASLVTCTELIFKAWFPALDRSLGIFIPLIVTNCAIVARAEIFASRNPIGASIADGLGMGIGFALLLMALGAFRELVGQASLAGVAFADGGFLLGAGSDQERVLLAVRGDDDAGPQFGILAFPLLLLQLRARLDLGLLGGHLSDFESLALLGCRRLGDSQHPKLLLDVEAIPLDEEHGEEQVSRVAFIREDECIGCTKCVQACPTGALAEKGWAVEEMTKHKGVVSTLETMREGQ